jgi:hypothetical protein
MAAGARRTSVGVILNPDRWRNRPGTRWQLPQRNGYECHAGWQRGQLDTGRTADGLGRALPVQRCATTIQVPAEAAGVGGARSPALQFPKAPAATSVSSKYGTPRSPYCCAISTTCRCHLRGPQCPSKFLTAAALRSNAGPRVMK